MHHWCVCVCARVCVRGCYITHQCQSLHHAERWSIQHLHSIMQLASLSAGRGESTSSDVPLPLSLLSAIRSLTRSLNWKTAARDGREEGAATGRRRGGTSRAPGILFPASFPSSPPGRIPRPNHSLLNNSACSSAVIWLFTETEIWIMKEQSSGHFHILAPSLSECANRWGQMDKQIHGQSDEEVTVSSLSSKR